MNTETLNTRERETSERIAESIQRIVADRFPVEHAALNSSRCPYCKAAIVDDPATVNGIRPMEGEAGCVFCEGIMPDDDDPRDPDREYDTRCDRNPFEEI